jgi:hypothetical protein
MSAADNILIERRGAGIADATKAIQRHPREDFHELPVAIGGG